MIALLISILSSLPVPARELRSFILVSEFTPPALLSEFSILSNTSVPLIILQFSPSLLSALGSFRPNLIFDYTYSLRYRTSLLDFSAQNRVLFFSRQEPFDSYSQWTFFLHPSPSSESQAIRSFLEHLNFTDFHLLTSESTRSKAMFSELSSSSYNLFSNSAHQEVFDLYSSRIIKPTGNWKIVALSEEEGASKLLRGLEKSRVFEERCVFIVSSKGWRGSKKLGTIGIVEEGLEDAQSEAEYELKSILRAINILENLTEDLKGSVVSNEDLAKKLTEKNRNNIVSETFSIVNYKEDSKVVGKIENGKVERWEEIVFPGNVSYINNSPPKVLLSANTRVLIDDEAEQYLVFLLVVGLQPMVQLVNKDPSILPNFELELHETDCGYKEFDYDYASDCTKKHVDKIGVAHIGSSYPTVLISYLDLFKQFNIEVPHITMSYNEPKLYDKDLYPEVLLTIPNSLYYYIILPYIIKSFRWNNIILIQDNQVGESDISAFIKNTEILSINILNSKDHMYIPFQKTATYYKDVEHIMKFIKYSKCRIITIFTFRFSHRFFIEALYDFGFRRGDFVLVMINNPSDLISQSVQFGIDRKKIVELVSGSLSIDLNQFVGEYGQKLEKQIASMIDPHPTTYSCYKIDSLMLAVHSIDLMINSGKNFDDFQELMEFMRGIRFTGCTGMVSIDSGGNGLSDIIYTIRNFYEEGGEEHDILAGVYTFGVMVPLKISKEIVWPSGTTEVPKDLIEETKCGFADILVKDNRTSRELSGIVTSSLFVATLAITGLVWRHFESPEIEFLEEKREMMFEDGVLLYFPLIETAQFIGLGPDFSQANLILSFVCSLANLDFDKVINFEFEDFWTIIIITLAVSSSWCFCLGFKLTIEERCLPQYIRDSIEVVGIKLIQIFAGAGFVGINFVLFHIFRCGKGIGDTLSQSFLANDCKIFCWKEPTYVSSLRSVLWLWSLTVSQ